eukprot:jgi/Tetstr1/431035/TSEL_020754.t1
MPNITSHVKPLDAWCIHTAKALYCKRPMTWILDQLHNTPEGETPMLRGTIRQAIPWFVAALKDVLDASVRNYFRVVVKITEQMEDLRTGCERQVVAPPEVIVVEEEEEEAADLNEEEDNNAAAESMIELADVDVDQTMTLIMSR